MLISIIIPTYKPEDYFFRCLNSIRDQTFDKREYEIIIILNGPKDNYYDKIKTYAEKELPYNYVRFFYTSFGNVSNARNIGIDNAKGEYFCFIDDDDYISGSYLQELYNIAEKGIMPLSNFTAFKDSSGAFLSDNISSVFEKYHNCRKVNLLKVRSYFSVIYCKLISRNIIGENRFNVKYENCEDVHFMFLISCNIRNLRFTSADAVYYRRMRPDSLSKRYRSISKKIGNMVSIWKQYFIAWAKHPFKYNFLFLVSRIFAGIRGFIRSFEK